MIKIIGPKDPRDKNAINTTSSSINWTKELSPFFSGQVYLYEGHFAKNVENGWQYSKVYKSHVDLDKNPTDEYWNWANKGWNKDYADRYPMGKGAIPEYCLWKGKKLGYIEARKEVYVPLYGNRVKNKDAFKRLQDLYKKEGSLVLFDYDGYDHDKLNMSMNDVLNCETRKMGHAFVLKMLLEQE